jgi:hypothetical protein
LKWEWQAGFARGSVAETKKTGRAGLSKSDCFEQLFSLEAVGRNLARTLVADQFVRDLLTILELAEAGALYSGNVYEDVLRAVIGLNEAITLGCVEPLYSTGRHNEAFLLQMTDYPLRKPLWDGLSFVFEERSSQARQMGQVLACQTNIDAPDLEFTLPCVKSDDAT